MEGYSSQAGRGAKQDLFARKHACGHARIVANMQPHAEKRQSRLFALQVT
jgi:hypothetical protein